MNTSIIDDLLLTLNKDARVRDIRIGLFHTAVVTRNCGLAATLSKDVLKQHLEGAPLINNPGSLQNKTVEELAMMAYSDSLLEAVVGIAAINSLIEIEESICIKLNAAELLAEKGKDKKVCIIGHFPFIPRLKQLAREFWVIEKNPQEGDISEDQSEKVIPRSDVVGITGTAITNHSIQHILDLCRPEAYVVILGDSAPLSPVLFNYGIDAISGTRVIDQESALRCVSEGATYRQIQGIEKLIMLKNK